MDHRDKAEAGAGSCDSNDRSPGSRNEFSGEATSVVQAGLISGGVHIHNPAPGKRRDIADAEPVAVTCVVDSEYVIQHDWSDAVPVSGGSVRICVEARERAVLLRGMRPVVVARRPPVRGTVTHSWGIPEVRSYTLNLDDESPRLSGPPFLYTVTPDDLEIFEITAHCSLYDIEWRLELCWTCEGRTGTSVADLGGHPFRTTARPTSQ